MSLYHCEKCGGVIDNVSIEEAKYFIIGDYLLTAMPDGKFWISHASGEGMQTSKKKLEICIHNFYSHEF